MSSTDHDTQQNGSGQALAVVASPPALSLELITDTEINRYFRLANAFAKSGMFKDARQAEQAFAKILLGRDLGLSPTQAMMSIYIVEGKPEMSANLQAQKVKTFVGENGERYDYAVLEHTDTVCELEFFRDGESLGKTRFTIEDAQRAGLAGKPPWVAYPRNMLFARCISNGVAFLCPEVMGGHRVYYAGEVEEGIPEPSAASPPAQPTADGATQEEAIVDADVVTPEPVGEQDDDGAELLSDDERLELVQAFEQAGVEDMTMFLTAAGFEQTDDLTRNGAFRMRELLGQHLQQTAGAAS